MNRTEAIDWLRSVGLDAAARDWGMGQTIVIPVGDPEVHAGITFYPGGAVYLCPQVDGRWVLLDIYNQDGRSRVAGTDTTQPFADLESAAHAAYDYVTRVEAERAWQSPGDRDQGLRGHCALLVAAIVRGQADLVDGCLELVAALRAAGLARDPDALCLEGFCSDSDRFPRGPARSRWDAAALAESDRERQRYVEAWRSRVLDACRSLAAKL